MLFFIAFHSHKIGNEHLKNIVKYSLNITLNIHMAFNCLFRFWKFFKWIFLTHWFGRTPDSFMLQCCMMCYRDRALMDHSVLLSVSPTAGCLISFVLMSISPGIGRGQSLVTFLIILSRQCSYVIGRPRSVGIQSIGSSPATDQDN